MEFDLTWQWRSFTELSVHELYRILQLRQRVFVVEQQSLYLDVDGYDDKAWHRLGWQTTHDGDPVLVAYARIFPAGIKGSDASFGRVITDSAVRGKGIGKTLVADAIVQCEQLSSGCSIRIQAQCYLEQFYADFGFTRVSDPYDEDGIAHVDMMRPPSFSNT